MGIQFCPICEKERHFNLILVYRIWGLWWIFNNVTYKKYAAVCQVCGNGFELDGKKVEEAVGHSHIPFMHKYGLWLLLAFFAISFILSMVTQ